MTSPVSHSQGVQSAIQGEEFIEDELHPQTLGNAAPQHPLPQEPLLHHQAWGQAGPTLGPLLLTGDGRSPLGLPVDRDPGCPSPQSPEGWGRQLASTAKLLCSGGPRGLSRQSPPPRSRHPSRHWEDDALGRAHMDVTCDSPLQCAQRLCSMTPLPPAHGQQGRWSGRPLSGLLWGWGSVLTSSSLSGPLMSGCSRAEPHHLEASAGDNAAAGSARCTIHPAPPAASEWQRPGRGQPGSRSTSPGRHRWPLVLTLRLR